MSFVVELVKLALVDSTDTELSLNGRNERRSLEKSTSESLQSTRKLGFAAG
jgi:hypothetical protein